MSGGKCSREKTIFVTKIVSTELYLIKPKSFQFISHSTLSYMLCMLYALAWRVKTLLNAKYIRTFVSVGDLCVFGMYTEYP